MCRLFGMLAVRPTSPRTYLIDADCSLYRLSHVRGRTPQKDGWGLAHYENGLPYVMRSANPVYEEMETFKSAVRQATSTIVVGHIRQASNPKNLPNDKLIGIENSQPFWYGKYVFAHNGTINLPDETEARLGRYRHEVRGVNDSEVYFWFLMKEIFSGKSLSQSFEAFVKWLDTLWGQFRKDHPDKTHPYVGLNTILSDGNRLFAFCKFHDQYAKKRSLCQREQSYWQMSYLLQNDALIIASEPLTRDDKWRKLDSGSVLVAEVEHGRVSYEVESIPKAAIR